LLIIVPAINAARAFGSERGDTRRPGTRTLGQRVGLDFALLAITGVALWQLRLYGTPLTKTVRGALGIDPLLVAAPAIGILAGSVVALRLVPLLAHAADSLTARGRDLVSSLGSRQLARRPLRYTRTALLIMLAISMGVFSVSYASTWMGSQRDQADYQVGADARVTLHRSPDGLPQWAERKAIGGVGAVADVMAMARDTATFTRSSGSGQLLALDAAAANRVLGATVGSGDVAGATAALLQARPKASGVALPDSPQRIRLIVTADLQSELLDFDPNTGAEISHPVTPASVPGVWWIEPTVTIRDASGLFQRFHGEREPLVFGSQVLNVALIPEAASSRTALQDLAGGLDGPVELAGIDLGIETPFGSQTTGRLVVNQVATSPIGDADDWVAVALGPAADWAVYDTPASGFSQPPVASLPAGAGAGTEPLVIAIESLFGTGDPQAVSIVRSRSWPPRTPICRSSEIERFWPRSPRNRATRSWSRSGPPRATSGSSVSSTPSRRPTRISPSPSSTSPASAWSASPAITPTRTSTSGGCTSPTRRRRCRPRASSRGPRSSAGSRHATA
jgi:hypothetical protein